MRRHLRNWGLPATVCFAVLLFGSEPVSSAKTNSQPPPDDIGVAWKLRAGEATKKLSMPGLDACDKALERGFEQFKETASKGERIYWLNIEIGGQTLVANYSYQGTRLSTFVLAALPARWLAVQKPDSKTLSILVGSANCALDLCTNNPFSGGPCVGKYVP
jgi:hypothetical protein